MNAKQMINRYAVNPMKAKGDITGTVSTIAQSMTHHKARIAMCPIEEAMTYPDHHKNAVLKAYKEAKNKSGFKRLVYQYTNLTAQGFKGDRLCQYIYNRY